MSNAYMLSWCEYRRKWRKHNIMRKVKVIVEQGVVQGFEVVECDDYFRVDHTSPFQEGKVTQLVLPHEREGVYTLRWLEHRWTLWGKRVEVRELTLHVVAKGDRRRITAFTVADYNERYKPTVTNVCSLDMHESVARFTKAMRKAAKAFSAFDGMGLLEATLHSAGLLDAVKRYEDMPWHSKIVYQLRCRVHALVDGCKDVMIAGVSAVGRAVRWVTHAHH